MTVQITKAVLGSLAVLFSVGLAEAGSVAPKNGCAVLFESAEKTCRAKVNCVPFNQYVPQAQSLYGQCVKNKPVPEQTITDLLASFETPINFRCCIGNALTVQYKN